MAMMYSSWASTSPRFTPDTVVTSCAAACEYDALGQSPVSVLVPGAARRESAHHAIWPVSTFLILGQLPSTMCSLVAPNMAVPMLLA